MNTDIKPNPKCSKCKCYWRPNETDIKSSGLYFKTCQKCRKINKDDKDKNNEYYKNNINCDCGGVYNLNKKNRHFETKRHKEYLENISK
jgi:hypothetical protein